MKLMYRLSIIFLFVFACISGSFAQSPSNPIRWRMNVRMISPTEGEVTIKATLDAGWHLYGFNLPKNGPQSTEIDMTESKGVSFIDKLTVTPAPQKYHDAMFDIDLTCWNSAVTFRRKFKVTDSAAATINCRIRFMGCNDMNCMPPKTETFSKKVIFKK